MNTVYYRRNNNISKTSHNMLTTINDAGMDYCIG